MGNDENFIKINLKVNIRKTESIIENLNLENDIEAEVTKVKMKV